MAARDWGWEPETEAGSHWRELAATGEGWQPETGAGSQRLGLAAKEWATSHWLGIEVSGLG